MRLQAAFCLLLLYGGGALHAQQTSGSIQSRVIDPHGAAVMEPAAGEDLRLVRCRAL